MKKNGNILIVDDNRGVLAALQLLLKPHFERIATLASPATLPAMLREDGWSVLLLDMNFTSGINNGNEGLYWLHEAKRLRPDLPVVLFTAYADIDLAVRGIKEGATDFVVKPWDNHRLVETLTTASRNIGNASAKDSDKPAMYWGESGAMQHLRTLVEKVARTDANVLITGENGTGKEMLARELHRLSLRGGHPLVTVDMGAVTETLFESELFGHVKGAFTDARADRAGKFEAADHGTLFLDEIGNLPYHLQAKLLTVLQRRSIVRVGSNTPIPVDIRLVCATNRDLRKMVAEKSFREDLFYRLSVVNLELPPLRERREEIPVLIHRFIAEFARDNQREVDGIEPDALARLVHYDWPGNIRELRNCIECMVVLAKGRKLSVADIPENIREARPVVPEEKTKELPVGTFEATERELIEKALAECNGNRTAAAKLLGISRRTLHRRLAEKQP